MKMKDYIKMGFGVSVGLTLGKYATAVVEALATGYVANDDKYMDGLKERNPEFYESLTKYRTKKEEES